MNYCKLFGYSFPEYGWVPSPTYTLRRAMILEEIKSYLPGRVLEMGPGSGAFLRELADLGYSGIGIEQSPEARHLATKILAEVPQFNVSGDVSTLSGQVFDYLFAYEVLEHIEDDHSVLLEWVEHLDSGGTMMLSVPAHKTMWDSSDVWAGHYRRYEKAAVKSLLEKTGLTVLSIKSYGWPLANMIKPLRSYIYKRQVKVDSQMDIHVNVTSCSNRSGIERSNEGKVFNLYASFLGRFFFHIFIKLQHMAMNSDLGVGYLIVAKKHV